MRNPGSTDGLPACDDLDVDGDGARGPCLRFLIIMPEASRNIKGIPRQICRFGRRQTSLAEHYHTGHLLFQSFTEALIVICLKERKCYLSMIFTLDSHFCIISQVTSPLLNSLDLFRSYLKLTLYLFRFFFPYIRADEYDTESTLCSF